MMADTIFALATGATRAAIAIIRLSGPQAQTLLAAMAGRIIEPRTASLVTLRDPHSGDMLDRCLVLSFDAGRSETGEPAAELHLHGSPAVVRAVLGCLARQHGLRPAEPGEFARRAFLSGRIDLAQLEGLADLIAADSDAQRRQAHRQVSGAMRDTTAPWRAALLEAAADVETAIDFAEDVDLAAQLESRLHLLLAPVRSGLAHELAVAHRAERVRDGIQVVIAGPPNAGKSTLLNALAGRDAAIVAAVAGTTRDIIEVQLELEGHVVTLVDTAGLRDSADEVERIGIERAVDRMGKADLVLWLGSPDPPVGEDVPLWRIAAKCDLGGGRPDTALSVSARTGENMDVLVARLTSFSRDATAGSESGIIARARHRAAIASAHAALARIDRGGLDLEFLAEELRVARLALDRLIGAIGAEEVLGSIFSRFCIGK